MTFEFKTLTEFTDFFKDETTCLKFYINARFENGEYCPHCGHTEIYTFKDGKRYRCAKCKTDFTIRTKTVFGESKLPLRKWFMAIYLLSTTSKGMSSVQVAKHVGVCQKTAWFMAHRLRESHKQNGGQIYGTVEADETYIGGKAKNMHAKRRRELIQGRGAVAKFPVFGMKSRDGEVRAQVVESTEMSVLHPIIKATVAPKSTLYTDEWKSYNLLGKIYKRGIVRHSVKEYVVGDCHTNGIESFWALLKRGYHGVYHWMSKKHLQRYVNEFVFRFNNKSLKMQELFASALKRLAAASHLSYKQLTAQPI